MFHRSLSLTLAAFMLLAGCSSTTEIGAGGTAEPADPAAPEAVSALDRGEAIAELIAQSFLPPPHAACVVDSAHERRGVWDTSVAFESEELGEVVRQCTEDRPDPTPGKVVVTRTSGSDEDGAEDGNGIVLPFDLDPETMPVLSPGGLSSGRVELDGTSIDYVVVTPAGFRVGDTAPVFLAFPPGGQDLRITQNVASVMYQDQAVRRGWVVVSPAAPGGRLFYKGSEDLVPEMLRWIEAWVTPEGGAPHLGGMSAGGISAFRIAGENEGRFASLMVYPGFPQSSSDQSAVPALAPIPVRMWVGEKDPDWVRRMTEVGNDLAAAGGDVEMNVLIGEPHVLISTQDGESLFNELDAARG